MGVKNPLIIWKEVDLNQASPSSGSRVSGFSPVRAEGSGGLGLTCRSLPAS